MSVRAVARIERGWLVVPHTGGPLVRAEIATGQHKPGEWRPAYVDRPAGVVKVRPPSGAGWVQVWVRSAGVVTAAGKVQLEG